MTDENKVDYLTIYNEYAEEHSLEFHMEYPNPSTLTPELVLVCNRYFMELSVIPEYNCDCPRHESVDNPNPDDCYWTSVGRQWECEDPDCSHIHTIREGKCTWESHCGSYLGIEDEHQRIIDTKVGLICDINCASSYVTVFNRYL